MVARLKRARSLYLERYAQGNIMSAVQPIHSRILSSLASLAPKKTPSGQMLLARLGEKVVGGLCLSFTENHPDLIGRVCVVGDVSVSGPLRVPACYSLLSRAMSLAVERGALWLFIDCEVEDASVYKTLGFRALAPDKPQSALVFYLKDFEGSWLSQRGLAGPGQELL